MTWRLTRTNIAIMAGQAVAAICAQVIKRRTGKTGGVMTVGAILVVGISRYVVRQFAYANHIVVAGITAAHKRRTGMIKGASAKGARTVTNAAILIGRHVVERFTACINTMAGCAIVHDVGMVNECTGKGIGVMA